MDQRNGVIDADGRSCFPCRVSSELCWLILYSTTGTRHSGISCWNDIILRPCSYSLRCFKCTHRRGLGGGGGIVGFYCHPLLRTKVHSFHLKIRGYSSSKIGLSHCAHLEKHSKSFATTQNISAGLKFYRFAILSVWRSFICVLSIQKVHTLTFVPLPYFSQATRMARDVQSSQ